MSQSHFAASLSLLLQLPPPPRILWSCFSLFKSYWSICYRNILIHLLETVAMSHLMALRYKTNHWETHLLHVLPIVCKSKQENKATETHTRGGQTLSGLFHLLLHVSTPLSPLGVSPPMQQRLLWPWSTSDVTPKLITTNRKRSYCWSKQHREAITFHIY